MSDLEMKNVIIIGPPASGKLTIAKALAKERGYFLFDNHRSIDAAILLEAEQETVPEGLCGAIRSCVFETAMASGTPIVFTMVYGHPIDDEVMVKYTETLTRDGEVPLIVQLHCTREDSVKRSQDPSRAGTSKIQDRKGIEGVYEQFDVESDYRPASQGVLHLNTSERSVEESVREIVQRI